MILATTTFAILATLATPGPVHRPGSHSMQDEKGKKDEKPQSRAKKLRKLTHELAMARLELQVAELSNKIKETKADSGASAAETAATLAQGALDQFNNQAAPLEMEETAIGMDRSKYNAEEALDELNELKAMYAAEEFAEMTKELVIKRGTRKMELAQRALAVQIKKRNNLGIKHQRQRRELEEKVRSTGTTLASARLERRKVQLEMTISMSRARFKIDDLEKDLEELGAPVEINHP